MRRVATGRRRRELGGATIGRRSGRAAAGLAGAIVCLVASGCGLNVQSPDLFLLTRTGPGPKLTVLVNDSGTISCNGHTAKQISSARLIQARDLSDNLASDAGNNLTIHPTAGSVYYYRIKMQQGTIAFPDRAGSTHPVLAQAELFALQAATQVCGLSG